jgi:hypothetical protein
MLHILTACVLCGVLATGACRKKDAGPSPSDNILAYEIKEVPVTQDYTVGAFYTSAITFNAAVKDTPLLGRYTMPNGVVNPTVMSGQINYAIKGGVDYFVFSLRSASRDLNNYKLDSAVVKSFVDANSGKMKFALAYNWVVNTYGVTQTAPLEKDVVKLEQFIQDFLRMVPWLKQTDYLQVNGKPVVYIKQAQDILSNDNVAIYTSLRSRLNAAGVSVYFVGMQNAWTPPARYDFRFEKCVDAIYHQSLSGTGLTSWDRYYLLPQAMDQNWKYSKEYFKNEYKLSFVPNISAGYDPRVLNPNSLNAVYGHADNGVLYRKLCNVAKMNADEQTRLILIDSFNDWLNDTQIEPSVRYGELYLDITRSEFKKQ